MLTLEQARSANLCRLCGRFIKLTHLSEQFYDEDDELMPTSIVTRYGEELAHTACLREEEAPTLKEGP